MLLENMFATTAMQCDGWMETSCLPICILHLVTLQLIDPSVMAALASCVVRSVKKNQHGFHLLSHVFCFYVLDMPISSNLRNQKIMGVHGIFVVGFMMAARLLRTKDDWLAVHPKTPYTEIPGFCPMRAFDDIVKHL